MVPTRDAEAQVAPDGAADVTLAPAEAPAPTSVVMVTAEAPIDVTMAPTEAHALTDVTMALAEAPAPVDEISLAQAFLRARFSTVKLTTAHVRRGRTKALIVCAGCKLMFHNSDAKYNHVRRSNYIHVWTLKNRCLLYSRAMPPLQPVDASPVLFWTL